MAGEPKTRRQPEEKPFLDHLEDLRFLVWKILASWGAAAILAFILAGPVMKAVRWPLDRIAEEFGQGETEFILRSLSPSEVFLTSIRLALLVGLIAALPLILYLLSRFLLPALKPDEKKYLVPGFLFGGGLFFAGVAFAYAVVLPLGLKFFWSYTLRLGIRPEWTLENYISMAGKLTLGFGLVFELPVVILVLAALRIIDYRSMRRKRPFVVVGILTLSALLTPPDVVTQVLMAVPLLILFEICVLMARILFPGNSRGDEPGQL